MSVKNEKFLSKVLFFSQEIYTFTVKSRERKTICQNVSSTYRKKM